MTAFVLCLSVAAGAGYLLLCAWLALRQERNGIGFYRMRGPWEVTARVWWTQCAVGVAKFGDMGDVHFGFIVVCVRYDARTATHLARTKLDRRLVDALVGPSTYEGGE